MHITTSLPLVQCAFSNVCICIYTVHYNACAGLYVWRGGYYCWSHIYNRINMHVIMMWCTCIREWRERCFSFCVSPPLTNHLFRHMNLHVHVVHACVHSYTSDIADLGSTSCRHAPSTSHGSCELLRFQHVYNSVPENSRHCSVCACMVMLADVSKVG